MTDDWRNVGRPAKFVMAQSPGERRARSWVELYSTPADLKEFLVAQHGARYFAMRAINGLRARNSPGANGCARHVLHKDSKSAAKGLQTDCTSTSV